jgi:poly(A) polymerase
MREIWVMQPRFEKRTGSTPFSMVAQPRFRAGFDFMRLRADIGEVEEAWPSGGRSSSRPTMRAATT